MPKKIQRREQNSIDTYIRSLKVSNKLIQTELELEREALEFGASTYLQAVERKRSIAHFGLIRLASDKLAQAIYEYVAMPSVKSTHESVRSVISMFKPEELAFVTIHTVLFKLWEKGTLHLSNMILSIARAVHEYHAYRALWKQHPIYMQTVERRSKHFEKAREKRAVFKRVLKDFPEYSRNDIFNIHLGAKLLDLLIISTGLVQITKVMRHKRVNNVVMLSSEADMWLSRAHDHVLTWIKPRFFPMVIPPKPWTNFFDGGYLTMEYSLVTVPKRQVQEFSFVPKVCELINHLQSIPWRVNKDILRVAKEVSQLPGKLGVLHSVEAIEFPAKPWDQLGMDIAQFKRDFPEEFFAWKKAMVQCHRDTIPIRSKATLEHRTIYLADRYKDFEAIYFPHSIDYRGRLYPVPAYLNPQGPDLARALLEFSEGVPMDERGVFWLKVHLANTWAQSENNKRTDKLSFDDRVSWAEKNSDMFIRCAQDPLNNTEWTQADEPWQFLRACFEWNQYIQNPNFVTHLPINVDGSCNGLQHISALLRDPQGAKAVNLMPNDEPQDIYDQVAQTATQIAIDVVRNGNTDYPKLTQMKEYLKLWLEYFNDNIPRSFTKRNAMTIPYGATIAGMREQIYELMKHHSFTGLLDTKRFEASRTLALLNYEAIKQVIPSGDTFLQWTRAVAKTFNRHNLPITWTSPSGWRTLQCIIKPYVVKVKTLIATAYIKDAKRNATKAFKSRQKMYPPQSGQSLIESHFHLYDPENFKLNTHKQVSSLAPNIIHSLDAAHLTNTMLALKAKGITSFNVIHDSYGVHAPYLDVLNKTLREEFVKIYERDILADLWKEWQAIVPDIPKPPQQGNFDVRQVLDSLYFFA